MYLRKKQIEKAKKIINKINFINFCKSTQEAFEAFLILCNQFKKCLSLKGDNNV